jgi:hypothetical protein
MTNHINEPCEVECLAVAPAVSSVPMPFAGRRRALLFELIFAAFAAACSSNSVAIRDTGPEASTNADASDGDHAASDEGVLHADAAVACPAIQLPASPHICSNDAGEPVVTPLNFLGCSNETDAPPDGAAPNASAFADEPLLDLDDDECKFRMSVRRLCSSDGTISFLITGANLIDGLPATGAAPYIDAALGLTYLAPNSHPLTVEVSPGTYTIGPVLLDRSGLWTMILHFYARCMQTDPTSPHAHGTFTMSVP